MIDGILTQYEKGWLEAAIDGEGSIGIGKDSGKERASPAYFVQVAVTNTNRDFVEKAVDICGEGTVSVRRGTSTLSGRPIYLYWIPIKVLRVVLPQLKFTVKEKQRLLAIELLFLNSGKPGGTKRPSWITEKMEEIWKEARDANAK